jgi:hypothetical protein
VGQSTFKFAVRSTLSPVVENLPKDVEPIVTLCQPSSLTQSHFLEQFNTAIADLFEYLLTPNCKLFSFGDAFAFAVPASMNVLEQTS